MEVYYWHIYFAVCPKCLQTSSLCHICLLCGLHDEDMKHFLLDCPTLSDARGNYIDQIRDIRDIVPHVLQQRSLLYIDPEFILRRLVDSPHSIISDNLPMSHTAA